MTMMMMMMMINGRNTWIDIVGPCVRVLDMDTSPTGYFAYWTDRSMITQKRPDVETYQRVRV